MAHAGEGQPAVDESPHPVPENPAVLATPRHGTPPEPPYLVPKRTQRRTVHGHPEVADVSTDDRAQTLAHLGDGIVHAPPELGLHLTQLRLQPLADRLPQHREPSVTPLLPADVRESEEVERLGLPFSAPLAVVGRKRAELHKARFLRMQFQSELTKPFDEFRPEPLGVRLALESDHDIISEPDDDDIAVGLLAAPRADPEVKGIVEVDVRQQRRCAAALGRPLLHPHPLPVLQHAGVQP